MKKYTRQHSLHEDQTRVFSEEQSMSCEKVQHKYKDRSFMIPNRNMNYTMKESLRNFHETISVGVLSVPEVPFFELTTPSSSL